MKTAFLLGSLNRGGTETLLLDVFRNAAANQLDAIGIYRKTGILEAAFQQSGTPVHQLNPGKNLFGYLLRLRRLLRAEKVNVVHAQQPIDGLFAWLANLFSDRKTLLTLHGYDFNDRTAGKAILKFILKRTHRNIYVSDSQRQYYTNRYRLNPEKQVTVYNGISFDKINSVTKTGTLRNELRLADTTLLLGTVGNFNPVRDQFSICRFLKLLADTGIDFHFVFVGKRIDVYSELYDQCVSYCRTNGLTEKVSFPGVRDDVPQILHSLDAFVYATNHDTFGIAVAEALAAGLPVFVNDWEVMTEITENGTLATLYKTRDEQDLYRQFSLFLHDRAAFTEKARLAQQTVTEKYSIAKHIMELKNTYKTPITHNS